MAINLTAARPKEAANAKKQSWYDKQSPARQKVIDASREARDAKRKELLAMGKRCESMLKALAELPESTNSMLRGYLNHANLATKHVYSGKNPLYLLHAIAPEAFNAFEALETDDLSALEACLREHPPQKPTLWVGAGRLKTQFKGYPKKGAKAAQICVYKPYTVEDADKQAGEIASSELETRFYAKWDYVFNVADCTFDGKEWHELPA